MLKTHKTKVLLKHLTFLTQSALSLIINYPPREFLVHIEHYNFYNQKLISGSFSFCCSNFLFSELPSHD
jgi:hypothetical protein